MEILMAVMGGRDRWRTMPWMVTFFGILVIPLGVVSVYFIIIQPVLLGTWCALCLTAALAMLIMIPLAIDEVVAMGRYLYWSKRRGRPLIRTFFKGGPVEGARRITRTRSQVRAPCGPTQRVGSRCHGPSSPRRFSARC